jgi:hypothetical protein
MIELLERICSADGTEFQISYWVNCLELNTGDDRISDLIFWPDDYFGDSQDHEMTAQEILETAIKAGRAKRK